MTTCATVVLSPVKEDPMRWLASTLMLLGILMVWTSFAYADSGSMAASPYDQLIGIGGAILASAGVYIFHRLVKVFEKKTGIAVPVQEEQLVGGWINEGRALAEEKARVLIKLSKTPHSPEKKAEIATNYVMDRVDKAGLREKFPRDLVAHKMDANVNMTRDVPHPLTRPLTLPPAP